MNNSNSAAGTKKVRITLAALTRVEYTEVVEVPADMTDDELNALVDRRYDDVDGGLYQNDPEYWERSSSCGHEPVDEDESEEVSLLVTRGKKGGLKLKNAE